MTRSDIALSIIIVSYNTAEITQKCIESILDSFKTSNGEMEKWSNKVAYEIIVVDNASTDNSVQALYKLKSNYSNIRIIVNKNNVGFAKANNQAVKGAQGKYILFLNSDIIVLDNAVGKLFSYYKEHEQTIQFLGGKLFNKDMTPQPSCGPFYSLPVVIGALFLKGDYWGLTRSSPNSPKQVDWVSGACILTTKECFEKLSGFDEGIFMYMDEIDLLYRAKQMGMKAYFYPESRFIHLGFASSGGKSRPVIQVFKGFLYFYRKHYPGLPRILLKFLLQLKAVTSLIIGKMTHNRYLTETYEEAFKIARMG